MLSTGWSFCARKGYEGGELYMEVGEREATLARKYKRCHRYGGYINSPSGWPREMFSREPRGSERGKGIYSTRYWLAMRREEALTTQAHSTWPTLPCTHAPTSPRTLYTFTLTHTYIYIYSSSITIYMCCRQVYSLIVHFPNWLYFPINYFSYGWKCDF